MTGFFSRLFGGGKAKEPPAADPVAYEGYVIHPRPVAHSGAFNVAGRIVRQDDPDGEAHEFIRADTCQSYDDAVAMSVRKARQIIDERKDRLIPKA